MASNSRVFDSAPFASSAANLESMVVWNIEVGQKVTRQEVMDAYGETIQGGIQASRKTPNIMLYTDLTLAEKHGYTFDGWSPTEDGVFYYSGQGPVVPLRVV